MASTIQLLQQMGILPAFGTCSNCSSPTGAYKSDGLYNYSGLILQEEAVIVGQYGPHKQQHKVARLCPPYVPVSSNLRYCCKVDPPVAEHHEQVVLLLQAALYEGTEEGYQQNWRRRGDIVEMDETMCSKCKYGLGDSKNRRRQWVFGGVSQLTRRLFMCLCPDNKRTKIIIQANVAAATMLPELRYGHKWVDQGKNYVCPLSLIHI